MSYTVEDEVRLLGNWYSKVQQVFNELNSISKDYGLSFDQFLLLEQLIDEKMDSPREMGAFFKSSMPAISRKLNSLQTKKYIRKIRGEESDQRLMRIEMTSLGREKYAALIAELGLREIKIGNDAIQSLDTILDSCISEE